MSYIGDFALGVTFDTKFCTRQISGAPFTLAGSPVISAYVGNSLTQITAGITLSVDFDSVTGLNNVRVVATGGNGYATASDYQLVITTGTVNSVSVVGEVIAEFSIENRSAGLRPTVAGRTLDVSSTGEAGVDWANVGSPTTALDLSGTTIKTTQKVDVDTIKTNPVVNGGTITFPTTATLASTTNITAATGVDITKILGTAISTPATAGILDVNVKNIDNDAASASGTVTFPNATLASTTNITAGTVTTATNVTTLNGIANNVITAASINADAITAAKIADGAIDALTFAAGAINAAAIAADAIGASELAADAVAEIQSGLSTLDAAGVRTAVGLASANLDTQLDAIPTAAEINAEVVDALNVDTYAEPGQEAPGATVSLAKKINYLYKFMRNKITQTSTTLSVFADDAATVDQKSTVSDDGVTFSRGEIGSGP